MKRLKAEFGVFVAIVLAVTLSSVGPAAAQNNTAFGTGALASPSGPNLGDSAFGFQALNSPTSGMNNTAVGASALKSNTSGVDNNASGFDALSQNTTGNLNCEKHDLI